MRMRVIVRMRKFVSIVVRNLLRRPLRENQIRINITMLRKSDFRFIVQRLYLACYVFKPVGERRTRSRNPLLA